MMAPRLYAAWCLAVLGFFVYAKYEGLIPFGTNATAPGGSSYGGGHGTGVFIGAHK